MTGACVFINLITLDLELLAEERVMALLFSAFC